MSNDVIVHFQNIQRLIHQGKTRALQAATAYSILTYWQVGAYLSSSLTEKSYGKKNSRSIGRLVEYTTTNFKRIRPPKSLQDAGFF